VPTARQPHTRRATGQGIRPDAAGRSVPSSRTHRLTTAQQLAVQTEAEMRSGMRAGSTPARRARPEPPGPFHLELERTEPDPARRGCGPRPNRDGRSGMHLRRGRWPGGRA
jgi:hypothetical protein